MSAHKDLDALRRALKESGARVQAVIAREFQTIHSQFEITPDSVRVDIFDVTTIGSVEREHIVGDVRIGVTL